MRRFCWYLACFLLVVSWALLRGPDGQAEDKLPAAAAPSVGLQLSEVKLPGTADGAVCVGGGGRYIVLHFKDLRKLGIFDIKTRKLIGEVSVVDDKVTFAAGLNDLVVHLGGSSTLLRYRLDNQKREKVAIVAGEVEALAMGSASAGPLIMVKRSRYDGVGQLYDLKELKLLNPRITGKGASRSEGGFEIGTIVNVSADGRLAGGTRKGVSPTGVFLAKIDSTTVESQYEHKSMGPIRPAPRGDVIYTASSAYNTQLHPLNESRGFHIPELTQGKFSLVLQKERAAQGDASLSLHVLGDSRPVIQLYRKQLGIDVIPSHPVTMGNTPWHQRLFLNAEEKTLVSIPEDRQRLLVADFDVQALLDKSGRDYLLVTSQPPTIAKPGEPWKYKIETHAKRKPVKLKLDKGPEGMELAANGELRWKAPSTFQTEQVLVSITDAAGQEIFHNFTLAAEGIRQPAQGLAAQRDRTVGADDPTKEARKAARDERIRQALQQRAARPADPQPEADQGQAAEAPRHPVKIEIIPQGDLKALVPQPGVPRAPFKTHPAPGMQPSAMRATLRVTNVGDKAINRLILSCVSNIPGAGTQTQSVDALRGLGSLGPNQTTDVPVNFRELPGAAKVRGVGDVRLGVEEISFQ